MSLPVVFRPEARAEFDAASDWYEHQAGLGAEFIAAIHAAGSLAPVPGRGRCGRSEQ